MKLKLSLSCLLLLLAANSFALITSKPTFQLVTAANNVVKLVMTTTQDMSTPANGNRFTTANMFLRIDPSLLTGTPALATGTGSGITISNSDGFGGYDLTDYTTSATGPVTVQDLTAYGAGAADAYFYMRFGDQSSASGVNNNLGNGVSVELLTITFPAQWVCKDCISMVTTNLPSTAAIDETPFFGNSASNPAGTSIFSPGASISVPLPVKLSDFEAEKADAHTAKLTWATATETNSNYFEVERAADGQSFNMVIAQVKASGNTGVKNAYAAYDRSPLNGVNYYRLKMIDQSGQATYSNTRAVRFDGLSAESASFYPSPLSSINSANAGIWLNLNIDQVVAYTIMDATGKVVTTGNIEAGKGNSDYAISNLGNLAQGNYYIMLNGATLNTTLKFSKVQ